MINQFDELTKSMAQSVTRRAALKKFGVGLAGIALACLGLPSKAEAAQQSAQCLPRGTVCGTTWLMPAKCVTDCCSHSAASGGGFGRPFRWNCR